MQRRGWVGGIRVWVLPAIILFGTAGIACAKDQGVEVKHPERFTTVKEWNLTVQWSAGGSWSQKPKNSDLATVADLNFSGQMSTVLSLDPETGGWSNKADEHPTCSASYQANKRIIAGHGVTDTLWRWSLKATDPQHRPSAALSLNFKHGTYRLGGSMYYTAECTRLDTPKPEISEGLKTVPLEAPDEVSRQVLRLPETGNDLSGSAKFPAGIAPFSDLNPNDWKAMPEVATQVPWTTLEVTWTLKPREQECRFTYGSSATDVQQLRRDYEVRSSEAGYDPHTDFWWLHGNFEGQVFVDGKVQLLFDKTVYADKLFNAGRDRVTGHYAIRRLARAWKLDEYGSMTKASTSDLPHGWFYDSVALDEDWLDMAGMPGFKAWSPQGIVDEFLVGVVDMKPVVANPKVDAIRDQGDAINASKKYPPDEFIERVAGLPEFKYVYIVFLIETRTFPEHPWVYRVKYLPPEPITLEAYQAKYKSPVPTQQDLWSEPGGGTAGWKEIVKTDQGWTVKEYSPGK